MEPRLTSWYSDTNVRYHYTGRTLPVVPWNEQTGQLRHQVESFTGHSFNAVLCNFYRNGEDYMGWHSDDEISLGNQPVIASLSLGVEREFLLRRKDDHQRKYAITLQHGSLLIMQGDLQTYWQHSLPKRKRVTEARINLTFRHIKSLN